LAVINLAVTELVDALQGGAEGGRRDKMTMGRHLRQVIDDAAWGGRRTEPARSKMYLSSNGIEEEEAEREEGWP